MLLTEKHIILTLIYADDILIPGGNDDLVKGFVERFNALFSFKDLGELHYFLGIEVTRNNNGMFLSQRRYVLCLLEKFNINGTSSCQLL